MLAKLPTPFLFPASGKNYMDWSTGSRPSFPPLYKSGSLAIAKRVFYSLSDVQWAWQHDSIRSSCDSLPPAHSPAKSTSEGGKKLQVVMAGGLLN